MRGCIAPGLRRTSERPHGGGAVRRGLRRETRPGVRGLEACGTTAHRPHAPTIGLRWSVPLPAWPRGLRGAERGARLVRSGTGPRPLPSPPACIPSVHARDPAVARVAARRCRGSRRQQRALGGLRLPSDLPAHRVFGVLATVVGHLATSAASVGLPSCARVASADLLFAGPTCGGRQLAARSRSGGRIALAVLLPLLARRGGSRPGSRSAHGGRVAVISACGRAAIGRACPATTPTGATSSVRGRLGARRTLPLDGRADRLRSHHNARAPSARERASDRRAERTARDAGTPRRCARRARPRVVERGAPTTTGISLHTPTRVVGGATGGERDG